MTANLGGVDDVFTHESQDIPVERFYFTDTKLKPSGWEVVRQRSNGVHPNLAAKKFKMLPPVPHRYVIWVDANIRIKSRKFAREALTYIENGLAVHRHPFRDDIFQEAMESLFTPKYDDLPIADQMRHYFKEGCRPHDGLYACGVIAWDRAHPKVEELGRAWLAECERWGFQDQLSFPAVLKRLRLEPGIFPHNQYESPWFQVHRHLK